MISVDNPEFSKSLSKKVLMLNNEITQIAKKINEDPLVKNMAMQSLSTSLQKQGGFSEINERFLTNSINEQDILVIVRHAKNSLATTSQNLNQKNSRSQ